MPDLFKKLINGLKNAAPLAFLRGYLSSFLILSPRWVRNTVLGLLLLLILSIAARATISFNTILRLTPLVVTVTPASNLPAQVQALESQTVGQAFDRDTTTFYTAYGVDQIQVTFEGSESIQRLRVYGPAPYQLTVSTSDADGNLTPLTSWTNLDLTQLSSGWNSFNLPAPVQSATLILTLTPVSGSSATGLQEIEFWGSGLAQNETDGAAWDAFLASPTAPSTLLVSGREYPAGPATVTVGGTSPTATFTVNLPLNGTQYRKAWLLYDVNGLSHWIAVPRSINGQESAGGWPLPGSTQWCTEAEPIHPDWLYQGSNTITFSMPNGVTTPYQIANLKVVVEEDDGANFIDNIQASNGNASVLTDGDETTGWRPYIDGEGGAVALPTLVFNLYKTTQADSINLYTTNQITGQVIESVEQNNVWVRIGDMVAI